MDLKSKHKLEENSTRSWWSMAYYWPSLPPKRARTTSHKLWLAWLTNIKRIFSIKLGVHRALVVNNWEIAKECLTINDKVFATRPNLACTELMGYNRAMIGFAPYGPYWRQMRKICIIELLSNHRLNLLKHVRESEVKTSLQQLYQLWNKKKSGKSDKVLVEMKRWFRDVTLNVILRIVIGKRITNSYEGVETVKWKKSLDDLFELSGKFIISDALPYLRWLDIGGDLKLMKKVGKDLDQVAEEWLREHKEKRAENEANS